MGRGERPSSAARWRQVGQSRPVPSLGLVAQCEHHGHLACPKDPLRPCSCGREAPLPRRAPGAGPERDPVWEVLVVPVLLDLTPEPGSPSCSGHAPPPERPSPGWSPCSARSLSVSSLCPRCSPCRGAVGLRWTSGVSGWCLAGGPRAGHAEVPASFSRERDLSPPPPGDGDGGPTQLSVFSPRRSRCSEVRCALASSVHAAVGGTVSSVGQLCPGHFPLSPLAPCPGVIGARPDSCGCGRAGAPGSRVSAPEPPSRS